MRKIAHPVLHLLIALTLVAVNFHFFPSAYAQEPGKKQRKRVQTFAEEEEAPSPKLKLLKREDNGSIPSITPQQVVFDEKSTSPGFVLVPVNSTEETLLLNREGKIVRRWPFDAARVRLLPNCNLLVLHGSRWGRERAPWDQIRSEVREYDWNGKLVWHKETDDPIQRDVRKTSTGNTLLIESGSILLPLYANMQSPQRLRMVRYDSLVEIDPKGDEVWRWDPWKHLDYNDKCWDGTCEYSSESPHLRLGRIDWTHINSVESIGENKWYDTGDQRFKPGNVLFMPRNLWAAMMVDRASGDVVWKYEREDGSKDNKDRLIRGHEVSMIKKGLPGEGNILIFDNGHEKSRPYTVIREVDPQKNTSVWSYSDPGKFFSAAAGSVARLPNGNTFISEDAKGRLFEVNPQGKIVWEVNFNMETARAQKYLPDQCAELERLQ